MDIREHELVALPAATKNSRAKNCLPTWETWSSVPTYYVRTNSYVRAPAALFALARSLYRIKSVYLVYRSCKQEGSWSKHGTHPEQGFF